jgi:hypothetical protein
MALVVVMPAHSAVIFLGQGGNVEGVESPYYGGTQIQGGQVPNTNNPIWGYTTYGLQTNTYSGSNPYGDSGTATSTYALNTLETLSNGVDEFQGQGTANAMASSSTVGESSNAHAQVEYLTNFDLTSSENYTLTAFSSSADASFLLQSNGATTLYNLTGNGLNGTTYNYTGTLSAGPYNLEALVTADAEGNGNSQSSANSISYILDLTPVSPVPLPATAWLFVSGLAGFGAFARRKRAA